MKAFVGLLSAVMVLAGSAAAAPPSQCQLAKVADLPVKFVSNRVYVPVAVNGKAGWFLIDTGSAATAVFPEAARTFGLRAYSGRGEFWGVGGGTSVELVNIAAFELSGVKVNNMRMFVVGHGGSLDEAGLIGRDILGHYDLEFDLANKALRLWTSKGCGRRSLAYWTQTPGGAPLEQDGQYGPYLVSVTTNGHTAQAMLDSGAVTTVVTPEIADEAGLGKQDYDAKVSAMGGIGAQRVESRIATFSTVGIGTETIQHARLRVADMFRADTQAETGHLIPQRVNVDMPVMLLGADFLRSHRVLIAPDQHMLYFTYAGGPVFQVVGNAPQPVPKSPVDAPSSTNPSAANTEN